MLTYVLLAGAVAGLAYVRLAPSDAARWHVDPGTGTVAACTAVEATRSSGRVTCLVPEDPASLLARLDGIALATPRTTRLEGSAETGRITWITRSAVLGFPDFTTAQVAPTPEGTRLDILARPRFGAYDWGVNAGRLSGWMARL